MTDDFIRGAWFAWDAVLGWINTQDTQLIDKTKLYAQVMQLRPIALEHYNNYGEIHVEKSN